MEPALYATRRPRRRRGAARSAGITVIRAGDLLRMHNLTQENVGPDEVARGQVKRVMRPPVRPGTAERKSRKERMRAIDDARTKKRAMNGAADEDVVLDRMNKIKDRMSQHDVAKAMRSLEAEAKALSQIEGHLEAKRALEEREKELDRRFFEEAMGRMALDGLREEEKEEEKRQQRVQTKREVEEQLEERRIARILEREQEEQEGRQMQLQMEALAAEEREKERQRRLAGVRLAEEMHKANVEAKRMREERRRLAREEEEQMLQEQQLKEMQEELERLEKLRRKEEQDKKFWKGYNRHKAVADTRAAEDEARARKYEEAVTLKDRRARAEDRRRKEKSRREMMRVLEEQLEHKQRIKEEELAHDREYARYAEAEQAAAALREIEKAEAERLANIRYGQQVREQLADNVERRSEGRLAPFEERRSQAVEDEAESRLLEQNKQTILRRLQRSGIEPRFYRRIERLNVRKALGRRDQE